MNKDQMTWAALLVFAVAIIVLFILQVKAQKNIKTLNEQVSVLLMRLNKSPAYTAPDPDAPELLKK